MSIFQIDESLCSGDGLCSQICPAGLITMIQDQPLPIPRTLRGSMSYRSIFSYKDARG
jgi:Fe-S-cluster-containing hydrogenase component 2